MLYEVITPESSYTARLYAKGTKRIAQKVGEEGVEVALDVNPMAVRCARINALLNEVECRVRVEESDLFAAVAGQRFDVILFNPPYFSGRPRSARDRAFRAQNVIERFAANLKNHLQPGGWGLLLLSSEATVISFSYNFV